MATTDEVQRFMTFVAGVDDPRIVLLRQAEVVRWLFGDLSFITEKTVKKKKVREDQWGVAMVRTVRPAFKIESTQWSGPFGELVCGEIYLLSGKSAKCPKKRQKLKPDLETDDEVIEVKCGTYYTGGTATEKLPGVPYKYSDVPKVWGKPLKIVCLGKVEKIARDEYGLLPGKAVLNDFKKEAIESARRYKMEFVGALDLLRALIL